MLADKPGKAIVCSNKRDREQMDAYELDIASGELDDDRRESRRRRRMAHRPPRRPVRDEAHRDGDLELLKWDAENGSLHSIAMYDGGDYTMGMFPMVVTPDGSGIWMGSNEGTDRTRLVRLDVADGKQNAVDSHPTFDIDTRARCCRRCPQPLIQSRRPANCWACGISVSDR